LREVWMVLRGASTSLSTHHSNSRCPGIMGQRAPKSRRNRRTQMGRGAHQYEHPPSLRGTFVIRNPKQAASSNALGIGQRIRPRRPIPSGPRSTRCSDSVCDEEYRPLDPESRLIHGHTSATKSRTGRREALYERRASRGIKPAVKKRFLGLSWSATRDYLMWNVLCEPAWGGTRTNDRFG